MIKEEWFRQTLKIYIDVNDHNPYVRITVANQGYGRFPAVS